jgi:hypothetical protein
MFVDKIRPLRTFSDIHMDALAAFDRRIKASATDDGAQTLGLQSIRRL